MNKEARQIIVTLIVMSSVSFIVFSLLMLGFVESDSLGSNKLVSRTPSSDIYKQSDGSYKAIFYPSIVNIPNKTGQLNPFNSVVKHSKPSSDTLEIQSINSNITLKFIGENPAGIPMPISSIVGFNLNVDEKLSGKKWSYDLNLPSTSFQAKVNITTELPISLENEDIVSDNMRISFKDIRAYGFDFSVEKITQTNAIYTITKDFESKGINQGDSISIDPTVTYNFSTTYEGINMWAWGCSDVNDAKSENISTVTNRVKPECGTTEDILTLNSNLDLPDSNQVRLNAGAIGTANGSYARFRGLITGIEKSQITLVNWTYLLDDHFQYVKGYLYNFTAGKYDYYWTTDASGSNAYHYSTTQDTTGTVNNSLDTYSIVFMNVPDSYFDLDYVKLEITYNLPASPPILNTTNMTNFSTSTPNLKWNNSTDAGSSASALTYHIQVDDNLAFSSINYEKTGIAEKTTPTDDTTSSLADGSYYWRVEANTSQGLLSGFNETFKFTIDTIPPLISITSPSNNSNVSNNQIKVNYTVSDSGLGMGSCWYTRDKGKTNTSLTCGNNITGVTWNEGVNNVTIYANDTIDNVNSTSVRFILDTAYPTPNITAILTTSNSQTVKFNHTAVDSGTGILSCKYAVFNSSGGYDVTNTTVSCNQNNTQFAVSSYATYNLTIYSIDYAGNENSSTQEFTVQQTTTPPSGGGGGGLLVIGNQKLPVIGLVYNGNISNYGNLSLEVAYSSINSYCSEKLRKGLAIADYSKECTLSLEDLYIIKDKMDNLTIHIDKGDMITLYNSYKNSYLFQGYELREDIDRLGLFTSVLGLTNALTLQPSSIDSPVVILETNNTNHTITYTIFSNKPLRSCEVISDTPNLKCEATNTTVKVSYFIPKTDFLSEIFSGTISITTEAEDDKIEQKKVPITFRVYNIGYSLLGLPAYLAIAIASFIIIIVVSLIFRRKIKLKKLTNEFIP